MKLIHPLFKITLLCSSIFLGACSEAPKKVQAEDSSSAEEGSFMDKTDAYWKQNLSPDAYTVLRRKGTEKPYTGALLDNKQEGVYKCMGCANQLFASSSKFESGTGWPSFDREITKGSTGLKTDNDAGMTRTEVICGRCGGHLGHVFDDGPTSTGKRYCMNSVALSFTPVKDIKNK